MTTDRAARYGDDMIRRLESLARHGPFALADHAPYRYDDRAFADEGGASARKQGKLAEKRMLRTLAARGDVVLRYEERDPRRSHPDERKPRKGTYLVAEITEQGLATLLLPRVLKRREEMAKMRAEGDARFAARMEAEGKLDDPLVRALLGLGA